MAASLVFGVHPQGAMTRMVLMPMREPGTEPMFDSASSVVRIWKHTLPGALFPDAYNPFALATVPGDWSWLDTKHVDMGPYFRRRGLIFADGKPLEPVEQYWELGNLQLQGQPFDRRRMGLRRL